MSPRRHDVAVVGGGLVGLATAMALLERRPLDLVVLEAEDRVGVHQSGHNSGVIHSGLYYAPGSWRARLCVEGREALYRFCAEHGVPHERCGKLVIAGREDELPALEELERRGRANGLEGMVRLGPEGIREHEPHAVGVAALRVPQTGVVDFAAVARAFADRLRAAGATIVTGARVTACRRSADSIVLETGEETAEQGGAAERGGAPEPGGVPRRGATARGGALECRGLVACAGLHADRVARLCGVEPGVRIAPFRGEYWQLSADKARMVRGLIYPVPDPRFPFLGVHLTRRIGGDVEAGPNALLALKREGYSRGDVSLTDTLELLSWPGFWRLARRHWRTGLAEARRSRSRRRLAEALGRMVPEIRESDLAPGRAGVRAMALGRDGRLFDDFHLVEADRMIHVLNAPSPGATASIAIGRWIAARALDRLG